MEITFTGVIVTVLAIVVVCFIAAAIKVWQETK
jgi:hypothetical protein